MKILRLQSIGVAGVPDGSYDFAKSPEEAHDLVVVTGDEGAGKTRFLELVTAARELIAPSGLEMDEETWVRVGNRSAKAVVVWQLSKEERASIGAKSPIVETEVIFCADSELTARDRTDPGFIYLLERYDHKDEISKLEYFPENRRLDVGGGEVSLEAEVQKALRGDKSPRKYASVPAFLATLPNAQHSADRFAASLERLSESCRYDRDRHTLSSNGRSVRDVTELSSSEQDAVIFAATAGLVRLTRSVVLVDRPELYASDPERMLGGLRGLGADNQLIVATCAPELAVSAPDRCIIRLPAAQLPRKDAR
ncbi:MAG: hypothetical protein HOW73_04865 [Polyangiaceae bacterium]|nr:hypothetical protein [Polyangiaceae bacterium]